MMADKTDAWSKAGVEMVKIDSILIGVRRRKKLKAIPSLARDIEKNGMIQPIVIRGDGTLVCGQRRVEAAKSLGWVKIPARRFENMTQDELRAAGP